MPATTSPFLQVNNLTVRVADESFKTSAEDVMSFNRSAGLTYEGVTRRDLRSFSLDVVVTSQAEAMPLRDWLKGRGYYWNFTRRDASGSTFSRISADGGLMLGGSGTGPEMATTALARFGPHGVLLQSGLGNTAVATAPLGHSDVPRISAGFFHRVSAATVQHCVLRYSPATVECFVNGLATSPFSFATLNCTTEFSRLTLTAATVSGAACTAVFDNLYFVPYGYSVDMMAALSTASQEYARLPYVSVYGSALEDEVPVSYKMQVGEYTAKQLRINGGWNPNAQIMSVEAVERGRSR